MKIQMYATYNDALQYLYNNLPMFQRVGAAAFKRDLTNTIKLCKILGDPQTKFRSIHVAGTNGKGSTSHMLASVLQEAGYKTGLYTSPHLKSFTERIRINGHEISEAFVVDFVNRIKPAIDEIEPSFFEITVAMAFEYFAYSQIDIAVVEVGLGGRLDSTNVISPLVSVITNIGWDHKDILGDTLEKIASEKAGIIKQATPVVISERQREVEDIFNIMAREEGADCFYASDEYKLTTDPSGKLNVHRGSELIFSGLDLPLKGDYQRKNLPGVLKVIDVLKNQGFNISNTSLLQGLKQTVVNTGLKGRWQKLKENPLVICDTGHNIDGISEIVKQISSMHFRNLHIVLGMVKDKDIEQILLKLPKQASYYFCSAKLPRALDASLLAEKAEKAGLRGVVVPDVNEAKNTALKNAQPDDLVFIGGSTFVVAEIDEL